MQAGFLYRDLILAICFSFNLEASQSSRAVFMNLIFNFIEGSNEGIIGSQQKEEVLW